MQLTDRAPDKAHTADPSTHLGDAFTEPHVREPTPVALMPAPPTPGQVSISSHALKPSQEDNPDSRTVLIVLDGQTDALISVRTALRQETFKVKSAFIIKDALQMLEHITPAAIFVGAPMPEDDDETLKVALAQTIIDQNIPVILIDPQTCCRLDRVDVIGEVARPIDADEVLNLLGITTA